MEKIIYKVKDINSYIKARLTQDESLRYIFVKGEISNFKSSISGHIYFSLKDDDSLINVVMFANYASKLSFTPKDGDEVIVLASIDVYVPRGTYQLFVYEMDLAGQGAQLLELEKLKKKLQLEGLFDESKKRSINVYPKAIGIITAKNSAAIKDLLFNIKRRYPIADIYIFYSMVQGEDASKDLLKAFNESQNYPLDTLIIGRGGGASEDLSAFNDETLVRAISKSKMPVISAVGHEIDITLVDYVADKRASTPTAAAELATIDQREILQRLDLVKDDMKQSLNNKLDNLHKDLDTYKNSLVSSLNNKIILIKTRFLSYKENIQRLIESKINLLKTEIEGYKSQLTALNPNDVINRGYSIISNANGKIINNVNNVKKGDKINIKVKNGKIYTKVEEIING